MTGPKRWKSVKESISSNEGIVVNFSDNHDKYYSAYRYICKDDDSFTHNKPQPNLGNIKSSRTKKSTQPYRKSRKSYARENPTDVPSKKQKQKAINGKLLTQFEVSEFLVKNDIHRDTELFYKANKKGGSKDRFGSLCIVQVHQISQ